jgi:hypothetical protein
MTIDVIHHAKILGFTLSDNLQWNNHVNEVIKKANKRLFFLVQLKRATMFRQNMLLISTLHVFDLFSIMAHKFSIVSFVCCHNTLLNPQSLERVQKEALSIISPNIPYEDKLLSSR